MIYLKELPRFFRRSKKASFLMSRLSNPMHPTTETLIHCTTTITPTLMFADCVGRVYSRQSENRPLLRSQKSVADLEQMLRIIVRSYISRHASHPKVPLRPGVTDSSAFLVQLADISGWECDGPFYMFLDWLAGNHWESWKGSNV